MINDLENRRNEPNLGVPTVIESIEEQIEQASRFGVRIRYVTVRHDQVHELANLFVKGVSDKKGHDEADLMQRTIDAINGGTAKWQRIPIVVVGGEGNG